MKRMKDKELETLRLEYEASEAMLLAIDREYKKTEKELEKMKEAERAARGALFRLYDLIVLCGDVSNIRFFADRTIERYSAITGWTPDAQTFEDPQNCVRRTIPSEENGDDSKDGGNDSNAK